MRHLAAALGAGTLLVLAAACGQAAQSTTAPTLIQAGGASSVSGLPQHGSGPAMGGPHLPSGSVPVAGSQVDASSLPGSFPRSVWTQNNGTVLGFYGEEGGCYTASASTVAQTGSQVTIRLIQHEPGVGKSACPMYLRYKPMSVPLDQPLGTRTVVLQLSIVRS